MKTIPPRIAGLVFFASALTSVATSLRAQDDGPPSPIISRAIAASVDYGNGSVFTPTKESTDFSLLGLDPGQSVNVTVTFPTDLAGQSILVEPLDGGLITVPDGGSIVGSDGTLTFQFQASSIVGSCRISVHQADDANFIHFWIIDQRDPAENPANLQGIY